MNTWSALDSARVVELFGAVREGLNIVLFMDLKPGELFIETAGQIDFKLSVSFYITSVPTFSACLAQLLRETSSLPEDLALHYLHQTLGALEHLHRRQIVHLDVKGLFLSQTICNIHMYMYYIDPLIYFMNFSNMGCKYCLERTKML